jgi:membrane protein YqaA with SNARE-associated domain
MWQILGGLLVGTAVSGVVPLVNAELLVAGAAIAVPAAGVPIVALVSTLGQMSTKVLLYGLARWAPSKLPERARARLDRAAAAVAARDKASGSLVFASAAVGLPPFYGVALAAGALEVRLGTFLFAGSLGRALRFGVLAWAARLAGDAGASLLSGAIPSTFLGG